MVAVQTSDYFIIELQNVVGENGLEWWGIVRKEHLGGSNTTG